MITEFKILNNQLEPHESVSKAWVKEFSLKNNFETANSKDDLSDNQAVFEFQDQTLYLHLLLDGKLSNLHFDLDGGVVGYRGKSVSKNNELISKAIGCKPHYRPIVLDATAGMGRDSFIMAKLGCRVLMQERCLAVYLLLENALHRLLINQPDLKESLLLQKINSIDSLSNLNNIDVIYLDPMFPSRKKSALVKKEMRQFKLLAGTDLDANCLLDNALQSNVKRVVVKRPKGAPHISDIKPSHQIISKNFRFDVYLNN